MKTKPGVVSVILVNYRGADDTITCLQSFADVAWPADRLQLIVVDNASGDGGAARIREAVPGSHPVESPTNVGFAGGCNLGAAKASGEILAFINNDARPAPNWIAAAVEVLDREPDVASVASKVLDWDGDNIDYVDGSLTWYGMGYKWECERPDTGEYDTAQDVLFATGSAMFVRAEDYEAVGGFDDRYFMFYEDVDLGWRLNMLGRRVRYVPGSVAYHRHHASMKSYGPWLEHFLLERNALISLYKNFGDEWLARALPAALVLAVRRSVSRGGDDPGVLDLARAGTVTSPEAATVEVSKETVASTYAIDSFLEMLPSLAADRRAMQKSRARTDQDLLPLFRRMLEPAYADPRYLEGHQALVEAFGIEEMFSSRRRIVVITGETLSAKMAGPAIRAWAMADALSAEHDVELVTLGRCTIEHPRMKCRSVSGTNLRLLEQWCDVLVVQGLVLSFFPWLCDSRKVIVVDVYNPFHLEQLEQAKDSGEVNRAQVVRDCVTALNDQLSRGDFFLLRLVEAAGLLARTAERPGPGQPPHLRRRRDAGVAHRRLAVRGERHAAAAHPRRAQGRGARDRRRRQGHPLGRRHLQLVRPPHPAAGGRQAAQPPARRQALLPRAQAPQPRRPRDADGGRHQGAVRRPRAHRQARVLQRGLGRLRRPPELPAGGRHRGQHPPRPRGDGLLLPHPHPRLPVGVAADRRHRRRHLRGADRGARAGHHRPRRGPRRPGGGPVPPARRRRARRPVPGLGRRLRPPLLVGQGAGPAHLVLQGAAAGPRPGGRGAVAGAGGGRDDGHMAPVRIATVAGDVALVREYFREGGVREVVRRAKTRAGRYWASMRGASPS